MELKTLKRSMSIFLCSISFTIINAQSIKPKEVRNIMQKVANWQIENFDNPHNIKKKVHHPLDWTHGALYVGMVKWAQMSQDDKYFEWLKQIGTTNEWKLHKRKYHADDHTVGQMYIELYRKYQDPKMIEPTQKQFDFILYHPSLSSLEWQTPFHQDRWNWCDALFMSPPVWAKLSKITGEEKYLDFMVKEYKATTDFLFDKEESLYYRDQSFMGKEDNGTKIFWSRGNGWVYAGLTNILNELQPSDESYGYFLNLYKTMSAKIIEIQTPKGHWAMSLLGQEYYPTPETSGSSFYTYGLAWGINNGILNKDKYGKAVAKGWNAMVTYVTEEGMLGYVQPIGAAPGKAWPEISEVYGIGAFLCAGTEVYKLYGGK